MAFQAFVGFVDADMLGEMLQGMVQSTIRDFKEEDSPYREEVIREIRVALFQLLSDEARIASLKNWALNELQGKRPPHLYYSSCKGCAARRLRCWKRTGAGEAAGCSRYMPYLSGGLARRRNGFRHQRTGFTVH